MSLDILKESMAKHDATMSPSTIAGSVQDETELIFGIPASSSSASSLRAEDVEESNSSLAPTLKYVLLGCICILAFSIRLISIVRYESVIHEFDPYFNYRATKLLASQGIDAFLDWFDDRAWYPLGRIIGGTIYPGLMLTATLLYWLLNALNIPINIRNVCVFVAPIFAAMTSIITYLLTKQVTKRTSTALLAAALVAVVPSYISRSVGGSFDNEGVAIFALLLVFYLWIRAVDTGSMFHAGSCALAYLNMVASWGGYVFIINLVPLYVVVMLFAGRYSPRLYIAYSTFYVLGTLLAMQVPIVGFNVLKQAECAASHGIFVLLQVYAFVQSVRRVPVIVARAFRFVLLSAAVLFLAAAVSFLVALQWTGRVRWTGRSLTLLDPTYASKHIPIIASVSEHQPTTWTSFFFDLHLLVPFAPVGLFFLYKNLTDAAIFVLLYGTVAWYFASVMVRLMLVLAPVAAILAAIGISSTLRKFLGFVHRALISPSPPPHPQVQDVSPVFAMLIVLLLSTLLLSYQFHAAYVTSMAYSNPSIVVESVMQDGRRVVYDDFREAYSWLRHNTPDQARILAWWDYGYQLSSMANRTVLVDNNTWNNTHIATIGRALVSTEDAAYPILQSLDVDYVLVVFGGVVAYVSDDLNKLVWPIRIGHSVFPADVPPERAFFSTAGTFDVTATGSSTLHDSLAYKLSYYRFSAMETDVMQPRGYDRARHAQVGVKDIKLTHLDEAFTSEHWLVRIYKVKPPPPIDPSAVLSSSGQTKASRAMGVQTRFRGCVVGETMLGADRIYSGGATGANYRLALSHATTHHKRFFAIARVGDEGHAFAFDNLLVHEFDGNDDGCSRPCRDSAVHSCGCADLGCEEAHVVAGANQEHNRRWAIFERLQEEL
ncbi:unnamed protein product [Aphanomyces euteiches]